MEAFNPGSTEFIQTAAQRALSNSEKGYVLLRDREEGAKFSQEIDWESYFNWGRYQGIKTFNLAPNEQFALMLVQNTSVEAIASDPSLTSRQGSRALFSLREANGVGARSGQLIDLNGQSQAGSGLYSFEDQSLHLDGSDRDYNDLVFQLRGATGLVNSASEYSNPNRDFLSSEAGQEVVTYANFDQVLQGEQGDDLLAGGDNRDWIEGLAGNDILVGGLGCWEGQAAIRLLWNSTPGLTLLLTLPSGKMSLAYQTA